MAEEEGGSVSGKAVGAAAGFLIGEVQEEIQAKLPVDTLKFEVGEGAKAERLTLGRWITQKVFLAYRFSF